MGMRQPSSLRKISLWLSTASVALKPIAKSRSKGHKRSDFGSNAALLRTVDGLMQVKLFRGRECTLTSSCHNRN